MTAPEQVFTDRSGVKRIELVDSVTDEYLLRVEWSREYEGVLSALTETATEAALTDPQVEVLLLAYDRGYFNSPRDVTMAELGDELGITQQAVASRLRRGIDRILGETLAELEDSV